MPGAFGFQSFSGSHRDHMLPGMDTARNLLDLATKYHQALPGRIRRYLNERGGMRSQTRVAPLRPASSLSKQTYTPWISSKSFAHSGRNTPAPPVEVAAKKPRASKTRRSNSPSQTMICDGFLSTASQP